MATITMFKEGGRTDPTLRKQVLAFLEKLMENDALPGLRIKAMENAADSRARTGRVNDQYRAVLYRIEGDPEPHYVYAGTFNHDEAIKIAKTKVLHVNPVSGVLELVAAQGTEVLAQAEAAPVVEPQTESAVVEETPKSVEVIEEEFKNNLVINGYTAEQLQQAIGIDPGLTNLALAARTSKDFNDAIEAGATWQGLVLLNLQSGSSIDDVIAELRLEIASHVKAEEFAKTPSSDDAVIKAFEQPTTKAEFAKIEDLDELKHIINNGSFDEWRTFLHPEQRKYVEINNPDEPNGIKSKGPYRISGGAGTGKTVVALHRTKYLYDKNPNSRVILTTFNKTLSDALRDQLNLLDNRIRIVDHPDQPGVLVKSPDALARSIWENASKQEKQDAVQVVMGEGKNVRVASRTTTKENDKWREAVADADSDLPSNYTSPTFLEQEYITIILGNSITTAAQYLKVPRPGRGTALNRKQRLALWKIVEYYRNNSEHTEGYSFPEVLCLAAAVLDHRAENGERPADHVIIDEAQDLTPAHWKLLRALVADGQDDLFIAEDSHQRIYGQKFPLSRFGINIRGRARKLRLNYRTTAENLNYAMRMLDPVKWEDLESGEESHNYISARSGPKPVLMHYSTKIEEYDALADLLKSWQSENGNYDEISILVRTQKLGKDLRNALEQRGIISLIIDGHIENARNAPHIMTMHRAKGMEYKRIVLFEFSDQAVPLSNAFEELPEAEKRDQMMRERALLYVASTRARDELVIMWSGEKSPYLP